MYYIYKYTNMVRYYYFKSSAGVTHWTPRLEYAKTFTTHAEATAYAKAHGVRGSIISLSV